MDQLVWFCNLKLRIKLCNYSIYFFLAAIDGFYCFLLECKRYYVNDHAPIRRTLMLTDLNASSIEFSRQHLLFGFVLRIRLGDGTYRIKFLWRRIALLVLALCLLVWFLVAALLLAFFKYKRDFSGVQYSDMLLLPIRMAEHRQKMGQYHIQKGLDFIEKNEIGEAFRLLRLGLINAPEHFEGRKIVTQIFLQALRRPEQAINVALKGLDYGGLENPGFLKFLFALMESEKRDQQICELVEQHLRAEIEISQTSQIMAFAAANAYYQRGHYDEAERLIADYELMKSIDGFLLMLQIKWGIGEKQEAINNLEATLLRIPNNDVVMQLLISFYLEEKKYTRARQLNLLRSLNAPASFGPKFGLLQIAVMEKGHHEVEYQFDRLYKTYGSDNRALEQLAEFAAQHGLIEKSKELYFQADESAANKDLLAVLLLRAYLKAGEYRQGIEFAATLSNLNERTQLDKYAFVAYAHYALAEDALAELHLRSFLQFANDQARDYLKSHQARDYLQLAQDLKSIGREEIALDLLNQALELDDGNQTVLAEALKLDLDLSDFQSIQVRLESYLTTRRPRKDLLQACYDKLVSDGFMFERNRAPLLMKLRADL